MLASLLTAPTNCSPRAAVNLAAPLVAALGAAKAAAALSY